MRKTRTAIVVTFAAALGGITSASCGGSSTATEPTQQANATGDESSPPGPVADAPRLPPMNPPIPESTCPPADALHEGDPCSTDGQVCYPREGCGPNGYECRNGAWHRNMTFCNPPRR